MLVIMKLKLHVTEQSPAQKHRGLLEYAFSNEIILKNIYEFEFSENINNC